MKSSQYENKEWLSACIILKGFLFPSLAQFSSHHEYLLEGVCKLKNTLTQTCKKYNYMLFFMQSCKSKTQLQQFQIFFWPDHTSCTYKLYTYTLLPCVWLLNFPFFIIMHLLSCLSKTINQHEWVRKAVWPSTAGVSPQRWTGGCCQCLTSSAAPWSAAAHGRGRGRWGSYSPGTWVEESPIHELYKTNVEVKDQIKHAFKHCV